MSNPTPTRQALRANLELAAMIALMLGVAVAGFSLSAREELAVDASPLARLPERIGPWRSLAVPLETAVERELRADFNLYRAYVTRAEQPVLLYVGYYGTDRGGRPEHTPQGCYVGAGWGIAAARTLSLGSEAGLRANEFVVERGGDRQLVVFWYRSFRRTGLLGGLDQNLDRMVGLIRHGRSDGALVRLSTAIEADDVVSARSRIQSFASLIDPLLADHWPIERPCAEPSGDGRCGPAAMPASERS